MASAEMMSQHNQSIAPAEQDAGRLLPLFGASDNPGGAAEEVGGYLAEKRAFFTKLSSKEV